MSKRAFDDLTVGEGTMHCLIKVSGKTLAAGKSSNEPAASAQWHLL